MGSHDHKRPWDPAHSVSRWFKNHPRAYWQAPLIVLAGVYCFLLWRDMEQQAPAFADLKTVSVYSSTEKIKGYWRDGGRIHRNADDLEFSVKEGTVFRTLGLSNEQEDKIQAALTHHQQVILRYHSRGDYIPFFQENLIFQIETPESTPLSYEETLNGLAEVRGGSLWVSLFTFGAMTVIVLWSTFEEYSRKRDKAEKAKKNTANSVNS